MLVQVAKMSRLTNLLLLRRNFSIVSQKLDTPSPSPRIPELALVPPGGVGSLPSIPVILRSSIGSQSGQWARRNGFVPGMIYGGPVLSGGCQGDNVILTYSKEEDLRREITSRKTSFLNTLFQVEVDGKVEVVLPRDVQLHPYKPKIISVNWLRYRPGRHPGVRLGLPLKSFNEERCPGLREGGWLLELKLKVPVFVHGHEIPDALYMDLRGKKLGDKIMASELDLMPGVVLQSKERDFAIAKILGSKKGQKAIGEEGEVVEKKKVNEKADKPKEDKK
jgi:large subunit ribosomal protein L25